MQISDLHNANFGRDNKDLITLLQSAQPDIIVITGDIIDSYRTDYQHAEDLARAATNIAPTYYVTGNHEARVGSYSKLEHLLLSAGVTVLIDDSILLEQENCTVRLAGLQDHSFTGRTRQQTLQTLSKIAPDDGMYTILLSHRPELYDLYVTSAIDLVFSGHAHGGQFRLPYFGGLFAPNQGFFPTYDAGVFTTGTTSMVVSKGLGNSIFPFRINNTPEVVIVELQR